MLMSATDYLWLVFGIMPAAFAVDLAVIGLVALWFMYRKRRRAVT
jgi:uncharacterized membrane protein